jgi:hypothetical protein
MKLKKIKLIVVLPIILGAIGGFAYYHFVGCASGTCPITSNPYISTSYGAIFRLALGISFVKNKK